MRGILSKSDKQTRIQAKLMILCWSAYDLGVKLGNNYPYLEPGNKFWNRVRRAIAASLLAERRTLSEILT